MQLDGLDLWRYGRNPTASKAIHDTATHAHVTTTYIYVVNNTFVTILYHICGRNVFDIYVVEIFIT